MKQRAKGYALFEFIAILLILTILAAFINIKLPAATVFSLVSTTEKIRRDIRYTQTLAMSLNKSYSIIFSATSYTITPNPPSGAYTVTLSPGITLSLATITFDSFGTPAAGATLIITGSQAGSNTLTVAAETGFVSG